jgi:hypoxanthine phosphoribosyltransferase
MYGRDVLIVAILQGSFVFAADLVRALSRAGVDWPTDFITVSSYGSGTESSGAPRVLQDVTSPLTGRTVLLVEDILESGHTLAHARDWLLQRGAAEVKICALLDKPTKRKLDVKADFTGFAIPDEFVVGYGLDYAHRYRGLPYIGVLLKD